MKRFSRSLFLVILLLALGCGSNSDSDVLVEDAIRFHLANRTDLSMEKMRIELNEVDYQGDRATAEVTISARDDAQARMQMTYRLKRVGNQWEVDPAASAEAGGAHGGGMSPREPGSALPPGHPPGGQRPRQEGGALPKGHPPIDPQNQKVPEGNPPISQ